MPVVLVVDEYHLDIRADGDLLGRYYLADVEVARDIAERFILFLGDDEMEFLAEDALQFAYDGVAAMQEGWLAAQKKKRRHRRAAAQSARRKDQEQRLPPPPPAPAPEPVEARPTRTRPTPARKSAAQSQLAKRIAAASQIEEEARRRDLAANADEGLELLPLQPHQPEPVTPWASDAADNGSQSEVLLGEERESPARSRAARKKTERVEADKPVPASRPRRRPVEAPSPPAPPEPKKVAPPPVEAEPVRQVEPEPVRHVEPEPVRHVEPEPPRRPAPAAARRMSRPEPPPLPSPEPEPQPPEEPAERFAAEGHHPAETSVGLLSRLRRQPKVPTSHVHRFQESPSAVGLVRRVCVECSYVSIGSDD